MTKMDAVILKAKSYGNGDIPLPRSKEYKDAVYKYSKLSRDDLTTIISKATEWISKNNSLANTNPRKWEMALSKLALLESAHAKQTMGALI